MPQPSRHAIRRVAIYARYSSDNQREASIDDQIRLCRALATREGWEVVEIFQDAAMSGSTAFRPGYQALLAAAKRGQFEVVMAEALDRLSRDQSDTASLHKNLQFAGISLYTCAEGEVNELHVGLKGTLNALYIKDLAQKTHRGQRGRVEAGKSGGGLCYGYDAVRSLDARGEPIRGERRINPEQAPVVQRIFRLFNEGHSPIEIARLMNAEDSRAVAMAGSMGFGPAAASGATPPSVATPPAAPAFCAMSSTSAVWFGTACATSKTHQPAAASRG